VVDAGPRVLLVVLAVLLSGLGGFLAAAEAAVSRVSRSRVAELVDEGRPGVRYLSLVVDDTAPYLSVATFLRVISEAGAAVMVTIVCAGWLHSWWAVLLVAGGVMTVVSFVLGGVSPRTVGRQHAVVVSLIASPLLVWLSRLLGPVARLLVALGNAVTPGRGFRDGPFASESELRDLVDLAGENSVIEASERQMIHSVFELGDTVVREVMVPRTDMLVIERGKLLRQGFSLFLRSGFSRVPVVGDGPDDVLGVVFLKDVARRLNADASAGQTVTVEQLMRPAVFVPESKPADDLLREMQRDQTHLAIVVDEYGGTAGLVTIEDILEEIVGEITDEYDREADTIERLDDGSIRVPAVMHIDDLGEMFDLDLEDDDVDTVGGLLAKVLGRVPIPGAHAEVHGLELVADGRAGRRHRIASVVVRRVRSPGEVGDGGGSGDSRTSGDVATSERHAEAGR
jgi:CBS domain containing-hemolysin-like protein